MKKIFSAEKWEKAMNPLGFRIEDFPWVVESDGREVKDGKIVGTNYTWHDDVCCDFVEDSVATRREIHITSDGFVTHAVMKENGKVIRRAKATCSPDDEYDFSIGQRIAIDRLFEKESIWSKKNPKEIKSGDKVKVRQD